jgi:16S rRNA (guanine(966)-N(2))-methyltransferase RsmD
LKLLISFETKKISKKNVYLWCFFEYNRGKGKGAIFLRVIAGTARRTGLVAPHGDSTRPTSDRAKEALFSILSARVRGARFLDLYCGSGAIGIEALSRGASEAVFVENAALALNVVRENLTKTKLQNADVLGISTEAAVAKLGSEGRQFDIIFLDPPYENTLEILRALPQILAPSGIIIAETDNDTIPEIPLLKLTSTREYGRARFFFLELKG